MGHLLNNRRTMIALAVVVAVVAIVIPTCRMVGCSMSMGGAMPFGPQTSAGFFGDCGGEFVVNGTPTAVVPSGADSMTLALLATAVAAVAALAPRVSASPLSVADWPPPPPAEPPRGMRFRL